MYEKILDVLTRILPEVDFGSSEDFVADGLIDSFDLVLLINELEESFDFRIDGTDIVPENFKDVASIAELVRRSKV